MAKAKTKEITLTNLLKKKFINLKLEGGNKKEVISELAAVIAQSNNLKNKKTFFNAIIERESLGSTGIGNGVAIPHAKTNAAKKFVLGFARKDEGIDFGALDGEKTYLFFILASPKEEIGGHLKILAEISRLVKDKFIVDLLRRADDKKEVLEIISRAKNQPK